MKFLDAEFVQGFMTEWQMTAGIRVGVRETAETFPTRVKPGRSRECKRKL